MRIIEILTKYYYKNRFNLILNKKDKLQWYNDKEIALYLQHYFMLFIIPLFQDEFFITTGWGYSANVKTVVYFDGWENFWM